MAIGLTQAGHNVTVVCNSQGYDDPQLRFPSRENWNGIKIVRVRSTGLGKGTKWRRASDFGTFMASCAFRLGSLPKFDVVISMTSPPLISFLASLALLAKARSLVFWSMDLNPDETKKLSRSSSTRTNGSVRRKLHNLPIELNIEAKRMAPRKHCSVLES